MKKDLSDFKNKKELKAYINKNGFYCAAVVDCENNAPSYMKDQIPERGVYFKAIASNGDLNRNGYIIRESAWKPAIEGYLAEGGRILQQHDPNEPVGKVLAAKVTKDGLVIEGYVFDYLTKKHDSDPVGRFSTGMFGAISTGHITIAREFENIATGQILSEEEFRALDWSEQFNDNWVMAVTQLDWLENSIVSIGANRRALVTAKDVVKNYIEAYSNDLDEEQDEEENEETEEEQKEIVEEKPESEPEDKTEQEQNDDNAEIKQQEDETVEVETPPAKEEPAANADEAMESNAVEISTEEAKQINEVISNLATLVTSQNKLLAEKDEEISTLTKKLNSIPMRKGLVVVNATNKKEKPKASFLGQLFEENGIKI